MVSFPFGPPLGTFQRADVYGFILGTKMLLGQVYLKSKLDMPV